ncbi:glycosyltransferase family 2 protein [Metallumcola ferriviriculae]|uniref:Glucosyl-3-phosphoglycerate synthase n=1 Tax=Metallumcola ferriviriculae TaxID=3039180 RepID=A0AAU0UPW5_9FIRM|nr:glycosyltransferase family 2 protein [Desulfitibacteraceae bacterium MK1]
MKVSVVIPAYNEEKTIGDVVSSAVLIPLVTEVIVVDDGSEDNTAIEATNAGARVISLSNNLGKGGAMMVGVKHSLNSILLFLDADLIGLTQKHVTDLILPVCRGAMDMTVGVFGHGRFATDLAQFFAPFLSGQRAVRREIIEKISDLEVTRFGVEIALTRYASENNLRVQEVELKDLTHVMKEEKLGMVKGLLARLKMYWEIAQYVKKGS